MRYQRKPTIVEAEQYLGGFDAIELKGVCTKPECCMSGPHLHTIHEGQKVSLEVGDWILPEPDGVHFYPCKPDIFAATYEPAGELSILGRMRAALVMSVGVEGIEELTEMRRKIQSMTDEVNPHDIAVTTAGIDALLETHPDR